MPRQQLINTINLVIRNSGEYVGQTGLRINVVEFGRFDQGIVRVRP